jgi:hypothetical protein
MKIPKGWKFTLNKRISILLFLIVVGGFYSCKKDKERNQISSREDSFNYYFPLQTDSLDRLKYSPQQGKLYPDINIFYSSLLSNMKEPNLYKKNDSGYIIRYTTLPAFDLPYTIRIQKNFNEWFLYYKLLAFDDLDFYPHYSNDTILKDTILPLNWHQFYTLEFKLKEVDITNRPTHNNWGLDGQTYILEVYKNGKFEFIHRWSPREDEEKEFIELYEMIESLHPVKEIK